MGQQDSGFSAGTVLLSFFLGGIIGAGVALLTAPKTGEETRKMIREFAEDAKDKAEEYVGQVKEKASTLVDKGKDLLDKEKNIITKAVEAGKEAYEREKQG
ncbi:MAG: YtxH-like protein [Syntrophorhabdus sp. PtaB.Bin047]|jgi:gas vesicle protein|nr:MAG: YtxH-like protein [Syntrophorhabdus sp. PtaB.Bin047]